MLRRVCSLLVALMLPPAAEAQSLNENFWAAARKGDVAAVKEMLDRGVDVNAKTQYGATALAYACDKGHIEVVKLLLERGANVNVRDSFYGEFPIGWAILRNNAEIIKLLLEKGAQGKDRVLLAGAESGNVALVKLALDLGGLTPETLTAAMAAATKGNHAEAIDLLKKAGAAPAPKPDFKVDAETLKSYEGVYKNEQAGEVTFAVKDGKLSVRSSGDTYTVGAIDKTTFTVLEVDGITFKFNLEGDRVVSFTLKQGGFTGVFKRVEK